MTEITTHVDIDASAEDVWDVLCDFERHPEWNPFIVHIAGTPAVGETLDVTIRPPGGRAMRFRPTVLAARSGGELRWLGRVVLPRVFDGEHAFRIEPREGGGVRFTQSERFRGLLVPLLRPGLGRTRRGFEEMNEALKLRAEARALAPAAVSS